MSATMAESVARLVWVSGRPLPQLPLHWTVSRVCPDIESSLVAALEAEESTVVVVDLSSENTDEALTSFVAAYRQALVLGWAETNTLADRASSAIRAGFDDVIFQQTLDPKVLLLRTSLGLLKRRSQAQEAAGQRWFEDDLTANFVASAGGDLLACNSAFCQLFGLPSQQHASKTGLDALWTNRAERLLVLDQLREQQAIHHRELELQRIDGSRLFVIAHLYGTCNHHGELLRVRGSIFDITARIQLEDQLRQSQKMEAVGRLASGLVHDFNNILTVIQGHALLLSKQLPSNLAVHEGISQIEQAAGRAITLTRQLLSFSRKRASMQRRTDLAAVIEGMIPMLRRLIGETFELATSWPETAWSVRVDPHQVEQVIMNLVVNARDAMPNGGTIKIDLVHRALHPTKRGTSQSFPTAAPGDYVVLQVEDRGSGIEPDVLPRVFDPFFTTKQTEQGTGLGLSTVYANVERNGGFIEISTEVGHGTRFDICYPRISESDPLPQDLPASQREHGRGTETILVVEDDRQVRAVIGQTLRRAGYRIIEAPDGPTALQELSLHPVDLLLIDVVLPGQSGPEVAARARQADNRLKTLYMSGHSPSEVERLGLDAEHALLQKPFLPGALARKVRQTLESPTISRYS